jgi:hypothetical protein
MIENAVGICARAASCLDGSDGLDPHPSDLCLPGEAASVDQQIRMVFLIGLYTVNENTTYSDNII